MSAHKMFEEALSDLRQQNQELRDYIQALESLLNQTSAEFERLKSKTKVL